VNVESELSGVDFGALGYAVGQVVGDGVPYFKLQDQKVKNENLKALGAGTCIIRCGCAIPGRKHHT
jgi:predicted aconitase